MVADHALYREADPEHLRQALTQVAEWLGLAVKEGRAALNSLRASPVAVNDLAESFRRAAENPTRPADLTVTVTEDGQPCHLQAIVCDEVYRIGYEAIRNAYAHAKATRLDITLTYGSDLTVRVADNGLGIDPVLLAAGKHGRFGLRGMRERAATIGGTLTIAPTNPGTCITLTVPGRAVLGNGPHHPSP
jgi:signal transduction histidine kinase